MGLDRLKNTINGAALVAAFAITDGVDVWSRALIARESSVQDVAITPITSQTVNGRVVPVRGYPTFDDADAQLARSEVPGVMRHVLMLNGSAPIEYLDMRASAQLNSPARQRTPRSDRHSRSARIGS